MNFRNRIVLDATGDEVYAALNDPDVLRECIPGCDELRRISPTEFDARVGVRIGPIGTRFRGKILLEPSAPPARYALLANGGHRIAGTVRGRMDIEMQEREGKTDFDYVVEAHLTGPLSRVGDGAVRGASEWLTKGFFRTLARALVEIRSGRRRIAPLASAARGNGPEDGSA